jgi:hypothetical protein
LEAVIWEFGDEAAGQLGADGAGAAAEVGEAEGDGAGSGADAEGIAADAGAEAGAEEMAWEVGGVDFKGDDCGEGTAEAAAGGSEVHRDDLGIEDVEAAEEGGDFGRGGLIEEGRGGAGLEEATGLEDKHFVAEGDGLIEVVGD